MEKQDSLRVLRLKEKNLKIQIFLDQNVQNLLKPVLVFLVVILLNLQLVINLYSCLLLEKILYLS